MSGPAYLLPNDANGNATGQEIDFDILESETHTNSSELTEHPIEKDSDVSDHIKHDPFELSLSVWVTNTPILPQSAYGGNYNPVTLVLPHRPPPSFPSLGDLINIIKTAILGPPPPIVVHALSFPQQFDKITDTHKALTVLERAGASMSVVTSTANYPNMVLIKVEYAKAEAGSGAFTLGFKQARIVSSSIVAAPAPAEPRGAPQVGKGSQATTPVSGAGSQSLAAKAADVLSVAKAALSL